MCTVARWVSGSIAFLSLLAFATSAGWAFPAAQTYLTDSAVRLGVTIPSLGLDNARLVVVGPTRTRLGDAYDPGDGRLRINTEIISMVLTGDSAAGTVVLRAHPTSPGGIQQQTAGVDFPADAWFDLQFELAFQTADEVVTVFSDPETPLRLTTTIDAVPPFDAQYAPESTFGGIALLDRDGNQIGGLAFMGAVVGQQPTFSVAPGGPSGLAPADLFKRSTAPAIFASGLSLGPEDDIDGLSYGYDFVFPPFQWATGAIVNSIIDVRFSVDEGAVGRAGSAVRREASKIEATADEFKVGPVFAGFGGGSNLQVLDENGDTAPEFPLQPTDNVDALAEHPPDFADPDDDGRPNRDIYFSLAPGSPALGANSAADILVSSSGGPPEVFISAEELGLSPTSDDIDALCVNAPLRAAVFSLAGSSDLTMYFLGTTFPWARAENLGLEPGDDVNALKCHVGDSAASWSGSFDAELRENGQTVRMISLRELEVEIAIGIGADGEGAGLIGQLLSKRTSDEDIALFLPLLGAIPSFRYDFERQAVTMSFGLRINGVEYHTEPITLTREDAADYLFGGDPFRSGAGSSNPSQNVEDYPLFDANGSPSGLSLGGIALSFDARPAPLLSADGFRDAASFGERPSPGGLASLFGQFPTERAFASAVPLPRRTGDTVEVLFETSGSTMIPAPLLFVDPAQINLQVPWEVDASGGTVTAIVRANGVDSAPVELEIAPTSPGVFTTEFGAGPAIAINADGTLAQPAGAIGNSRPAAVGDVLVLLVSGLGSTTPEGVTGDDSFDSSGAFVQRDTVQEVRVTIGGVEAPVAFAGLSPQFVGVYQLNVTVPEEAPLGDAVPLVVEVGGRSSRADVTLAIIAAP